MNAGIRENKLKYRGQKYTIPYRSFLPRGINNLLLNGRCISGTHIAHGSYRVMPICFAMGEGVGCAAAFTVRDGVGLGDMLIPERMRAMQEVLFCNYN